MERITRFPHLRVQLFTNKMSTLKPSSDFTDYEKVWKSGVKALEWQRDPAHCSNCFQWLVYRIVHQWWVLPFPFLRLNNWCGRGGRPQGDRPQPLQVTPRFPCEDCLLLARSEASGGGGLTRLSGEAVCSRKQVNLKQQMLRQRLTGSKFWWCVCVYVCV